MVQQSTIAFSLAQALVLTLFLSPFTPPDLSQSLVQDLRALLLPGTVSVEVEKLSLPLPWDWQPSQTSDLLLEATFDRHVSELLSHLVEDRPWVRVLSLQEGLETSVHLARKAMGNGVMEVIRRFNWKAVSLVTEPVQGINYLENQMRKEDIEINSYVLASDASYEMIAALLAKEIKVWSSPVIVCAAAPQTCSLLLQAAQQANMIKAGYAYILLHPPRVLQVPAVPGLLHVLEKGSEAAQSLSEYHAMRVAY